MHGAGLIDKVEQGRGEQRQDLAALPIVAERRRVGRRLPRVMR